MPIKDSRACAQVVLTLGIVVAQAINIGTQHVPGYGWRISLACAGLPAVVLTLGGLLLPETPNSLIERGFEEQGKQVLAGSGTLPDVVSCTAAPYLHALVSTGSAIARPFTHLLWSTMVSISGLFYCLNEIVCGHSTMDFLGGVGFQVLRDIRGIDDVEEEFGDIRAACTKAASITNPWRTICRRAYAPQLFIAITATLFQQWTGVELLPDP